jgi:CRP-like cAMP-binding protein
VQLGNNEMVEIELRAIMKSSSALKSCEFASEAGYAVSSTAGAIRSQSVASSFLAPVSQLTPRLKPALQSACAQQSASAARDADSALIPLDELSGMLSCEPSNTSASAVSSPLQNRLLAALSLGEFDRLLPHLELVKMPLGEVLYESGGRLNYVVFPTTSIVSLQYVLEDGASTEIAAVGNEGILGVSIFMGGDTTPSRAVVQSAGYGYRIKTQYLKQEFERAGGLFKLLLRYTQALMTQTSQMAVCNRHHSLEQQLCRRLLFSLDRLPTESLFMTQEMIANMLGVRREGVTAAAGNLQRAGHIRYSRGRIDVLDRSGLESSVCECYSVVKLEFNRLLSDNHRSDPFHVLRESGQQDRRAPMNADEESLNHFPNQNQSNIKRNSGSASYA